MPDLIISAAASRDPQNARMQNKFDDSRRRVENRKRSIPLFDFPSELPITARQKPIIETIRDHSVVVITGETGSGKTTQIPKMCLTAGLGRRGMIGLTQPRRIAAISIASRIASELGQSCG